MKLSKHLKRCYQTKTNREMFKHGFQFFGNLLIFFSYFFFKFVQNFKPKKKKKKTHHHMCV
jgi:hypothetical protein